MKALFTVYLSLLLLLALTLAAHHWPLGHWQTPLALSIAALKAVLVAWFFMSLKTSHGLHRLFASAGLLWIVFFYLLAGLDFYFRVALPKALL
jgi:cytochrome c oxidase subunit 4